MSLTKKCPENQEWNPRLKKCVPCPGGKIRSKGKGRGKGYGRGRGPIGIPIEEKGSTEYWQLDEKGRVIKHD